MQRHGRLLENQGDVLAANSLKLVGVGLKKIPPFKQDRAARDDRVPTKESQDGCGECTFPRSRFPEDPQDLAGFKTKTDSVKRLVCIASARAVGDSEISNFQNRSHARMLKQDGEADKTNVFQGEPKVIL